MSDLLVLEAGQHPQQGHHHLLRGRSEHKVLTSMYWIIHLRNSIISVGQMDEGGLRVLIKGGVLKIWDRQ
jgi:hypothetical protein